MPERSKKPKRPRDINVLAHEIVREFTGGEPEASAKEDTRNPHAVALGRLGGKKGGKARAEKLTPEKRSAISRKAGKASWKKN